MARVTPLHELHAELGASFTEFAGWSMPLWYGSEIEEHRAVRSTAGLFDLSHMGQIEVTGADAAAALDYAVVGHPSALRLGRARYSMVCREDGGVLDDVVIYRLEEGTFLVVANAANVEVVATTLKERAAGFGATIMDVSATRALIAIQGPHAAEILAECTEADLDQVGYYGIVDAAISGSRARLARTGYTGEDGFEIFCSGDDAPDIWSALLKLGDGRGLLPAGLACRDTLRLEAGMPLYGNELSLERTPYEAGLGRVVVLDKPGGFVGREALVARANSRPSELLVGLVSSGRRSPRQGHSVLSPETGDVVGEVTSGALSPTLGHPVAMAYVAAEMAMPGRGVIVDVRGRHQPAQLAELPFYRRARSRSGRT